VILIKVRNGQKKSKYSKMIEDKKDPRLAFFFLSADSVEMENDEEINVYATEYLNTIELPGKYIFKKNILKA